MDIDNIEKYGKLKGLNLIGTGDFTHPLWLQEMKEKLKPVDGTGFYQHEDKDVFFMLTAEISLIYTQDGKGRRVHHVLFAPNFGVVDQVNELLLKYGRMDYDGRPIFGKLPSYELVEKLMQISKDIMVVPAHIWTPWYAMFGSMSGFDRPEDCFKDQLKNIHALETGMSSDPKMNWRISYLDKFTLLSNSDSHSPWINRMGREANVFETNMNYKDVIDVIKKGDRKKFLYTIEVDPGWGKYHWDGHRNCDVCLSPKETKKHKGICPVCGRKLTIGVEYRVEELADRKEGFVKENHIPYKTLIPLSELVGFVYGIKSFSKKVWQESEKMIDSFGSELNVLLDVPEEKLKDVANEKLVKVIMLNREGKVKIKPGYDGVYGEIVLGNDAKIKKAQSNLMSYVKK